MSDRRHRTAHLGVAADPEVTAVLPRIRDEHEIDPADLLIDRREVCRPTSHARVRSVPAPTESGCFDESGALSAMESSAPQRRRWVKMAFDATVLVVIVAVFGILAVGVVIPKAAGAVPYTILTGSMTGTYDAGSLVVVRPIEASTLTPGRVITYQLRSGRSTVVTHRIVSIYADGAGRLRFVTKGDANDAQDPDPVRPEQIRGAVWYSVPYLGRLNALLTGTVRTVVIGLIAAVLFTYAAVMIIGGIREDRRARASRSPTPGPWARSAARAHESLRP